MPGKHTSAHILHCWSHQNLGICGNLWESAEVLLHAAISRFHFPLLRPGGAGCRYDGDGKFPQDLFHFPCLGDRCFFMFFQREVLWTQLAEIKLTWR